MILSVALIRNKLSCRDCVSRKAVHSQAVRSYRLKTFRHVVIWICGVAFGYVRVNNVTELRIQRIWPFSDIGCINYIHVTWFVRPSLRPSLINITIRQSCKLLLGCQKRILNDNIIEGRAVGADDINVLLYRNGLIGESAMYGNGIAVICCIYSFLQGSVIRIADIAAIRYACRRSLVLGLCCKYCCGHHGDDHHQYYKETQETLKCSHFLFFFQIRFTRLFCCLLLRRARRDRRHWGLDAIIILCIFSAVFSHIGVIHKPPAGSFAPFEKISNFPGRSTDHPYLSPAEKDTKRIIPSHFAAHPILPPFPSGSPRRVQTAAAFGLLLHFLFPIEDCPRRNLRRWTLTLPPCGVHHAPKNG